MKRILKQVYCENCNKTFVVSKDTYFCSECGSALTVKSEYEDPVFLEKRQKTKKVVKITALVLSVLIIASGVTCGILYKNGIDKVNETSQLIEMLPDSVSNYDTYDDLINNAYNSYLNLSERQKEKVSNKDKLLTIIPAYNEYKVNTLRTEMQKVNVDSVETTTVLSDIINLFDKLNSNQKALLASDETYALENYIKINDVIKGINDINEDLVNRYDDVKDVQKIYYSIDPQFTNLVYNYGLVEEFEDKLAFLNLFVFEQNEAGTYSIKVKDPTKLSGKVELPAKYNGQDVVKIPDYAFENCKNVTSFIVPDSVSEIRVGAFKGCNGVECVFVPFVGETETTNTYLSFIFGGSVPQSLKNITVTKQDRIENSMFENCNYIESVTFAQPIEYLGSKAFYGCESLKRLNSETEGLLNVSGDLNTIGEASFQNCTSITSIKLSNEILYIGNYAFSGCKNISYLDLSDRIIKIGDYAFQDLKKIVSVVVPNSTESIGVGAFKGCNKLEEISLPFTGNRINSSAYNAVFGFIFGYDAITNTDFHTRNKSDAFVNTDAMSHDTAIWQYSCYNANRDWGDYKIQCYYYYIPRFLKSVIITKQTEVKTAAFNGCTMLTSITYSQGIESEGECAFQNCTAIINK